MLRLQRGEGGVCISISILSSEQRPTYSNPTVSDHWHTTAPHVNRPLTPPPAKGLALFFDGTWNAPENNTNVGRLSLMLAERGTDGVPQKKFYEDS